MAEVTVAIPYWRSPDTIRRAVESVLAQTCSDLLCVVVNDGDHQTPPWPALAAITDPRLVRHDLPVNHGRYFVDAVTAAACTTRWWVPHDADDWSEPGRLATLVKAADDDTDVVLTQFVNHYPDRRTSLRPVRGLLPDRRLRYTAHLSGLWRTTFARPLTHPSYRCAYDAVMTTAAMLTGNVAVVDEPSYHRVYRDGSLVTSNEHGKGSTYRRGVKRDLRALWQRCLDAYDRTGDLTKVIAGSVPLGLAAQVETEAAWLRTVLEAR